jgi:hypothetical protein
VAAAILWAVDRGAHLVNLSLSVLPSSAAMADLVGACRKAARSRVAVVVARPPESFHRAARRAAGARHPSAAGQAARPLDRRPEVIAVGTDPRCPPGLFRADRCRPAGFLASPLARTLPGLAPQANFRGPSLAAARMSGFAGKVLEATGPLPPRELRRILGSWARRIAEVDS